MYGCVSREKLDLTSGGTLGRAMHSRLGTFVAKKPSMFAIFNFGSETNIRLEHPVKKSLPLNISQFGRYITVNEVSP